MIGPGPLEQQVARVAQDIIDHPERRADAIVDRLLPHVPNDDSVIDIGAGGCRVAQRLIHRAGALVVPIDVVQFNETDDLYLHLYDGETLPYEDGSFNTSLLAFVLHHAEDEGRLLDEARRVARDKVIVIEDSPDVDEMAAWEQLDRALNYDRHPAHAIAHGTRTAEEWRAVFEEHSLGITSMEQFRSPALTGDLYPHTTFVLEHAIATTK